MNKKVFFLIIVIVVTVMLGSIMTYFLLKNEDYNTEDAYASVYTETDRPICSTTVTLPISLGTSDN